MGIIQQILSNTLLLIGFGSMLVAGLCAYIFRWSTRHQNVLWQVSEVGRNGVFREVDPKTTTSVTIRTKDRFKAVRRKGPIPTKAGRYKSFTIYPTKLATGYVWELESGKESRTLWEVIRDVMGKEFIDQLEVAEIDLLNSYPGQFNEDQKIGSLYDALEYVWGPQLIEKLEPEYKRQIIDSNLYVTVDLEKGHTPEGFQNISDQDITHDANRIMANLLAQGVEGISKRDWVFIGAVFLGGMGAMLMMQAIGLVAQ